MLDDSKPYRCYRLNIFPYRDHTVVTLTRTDWHGRTEWDRRENTWDLKIPAEELRVTDSQTALLYVLRELIDRLDPPQGDPWAQPPESPVGDYRGQQDALTGLLLPT